MFNRSKMLCGQGIVEYALILTLIVAGVLIILVLLGPAVGSIITSVLGG